MGKDVLSYTRPALYTLDVCPGVSKKLEHLVALERTQVGGKRMNKNVGVLPFVAPATIFLVNFFSLRFDRCVFHFEYFSLKFYRRYLNVLYSYNHHTRSYVFCYLAEAYMPAF